MHRAMPFVFLMCSERSGSNLITKIMDGHSLFCGPSPPQLLGTLLQNRRRYGDLREDTCWRTLLEDTLALFETKLSVWSTSWTLEELEAAVQERSIAALVRSIYEREARACAKQRVFVKENHLYRAIPCLEAGFPDSRYLFLVRDPRDMALSWKRSPVLRGDILRAAGVWKSDQQAGLCCLAALAEQGRMLLVHYEELVGATEECWRRITAFLEIPFEARALDLASSPMTVANAHRSPDWKNLRKPIMSANFGKYRDSLDEREIRYIEALCGGEMNLLGYAREFAAPGDLYALARELIGAERGEKEGYAALPGEEKARHAARRKVLRRIAARTSAELVTVS